MPDLQAVPPGCSSLQLRFALHVHNVRCLNPGLFTPAINLILLCMITCAVLNRHQIPDQIKNAVYASNTSLSPLMDNIKFDLLLPWDFPDVIRHYLRNWPKSMLYLLVMTYDQTHDSQGRQGEWG